MVRRAVFFFMPEIFPLLEGAVAYRGIAGCILSACPYAAAQEGGNSIASG